MEQLPEPQWKLYFGISGGKFIITPSEPELQVKAKEFGLSNKATFGAIGSVGAASVYNILQGKMTPAKQDKFKSIVGYFPYHNWLEVAEKGFKHPMFLPPRGCFGFINGHLILGNRHHQEVMFRLINDKGWTWEQLLNAKQVWGWFYAYEDRGTLHFSSDAGSMTSAKVKKDCVQEFSDWFGKPFEDEGSGYGGKAKSEYGGDFKHKYGDPESQTWDGYRADEENTIITPLPDPPEQKVVLNES